MLFSSTALVLVLTTMPVASSGDVCGNGCEGESIGQPTEILLSFIIIIFNSKCYLTLEENFNTTRLISCVGKLYS